MKTYVPKKEEIEKKWWLIDAEGKILGRLATEISIILRGEKKPKNLRFMGLGEFFIFG